MIKLFIKVQISCYLNLYDFIENKILPPCFQLFSRKEKQQKSRGTLSTLYNFYNNALFVDSQFIVGYVQ